MNIQEAGGLAASDRGSWTYGAGKTLPSLYSFLPMFPRPNTHHILYRQDKNFPIANASRMGRCHNGVDDIVHLLFWSKDFELGLGQKIYHILRPSIQFCVPFWRPKPFTSVTVSPCTPTVLRRSLDFIELERLDDGFNLFHHAPHPPNLYDTTTTVRRRRAGEPDSRCRVGNAPWPLNLRHRMIRVGDSRRQRGGACGHAEPRVHH